MHRSRRDLAFSLIELLVVISIITLLISITLPALNMAKCHSQTTKCLSNMNQMGDAMHAFTVDTNGVLPGPSWYGQTARYNKNTLTVARFLAPYMGFEKTPTGNAVNEFFICPSFERVRPDAFAAEVCVIYGAMSEPRSDGKRVFGYPAFNGNPRYEPSKLTTVRNPSSAKAIRDIDNQLNGTAGWGTQTAIVPIHCYDGSDRATRNYLFFDTHAESIHEDIYNPAP